MEHVNIGRLERAPQAALIQAMADRCASDKRIWAAWVGGSLAAGQGDAFSDVDFRIAVDPGQVDAWTRPDWSVYLPLRPAGGLMARFGAGALLHHLVLEDGVIVDFFVQETTEPNPEPSSVVLFCRDAQLRAHLDESARPAPALVRDLDPEAARQLFVDYWVTTHKQMKALVRQYDATAFVGLYYERLSLLRAWYMVATGRDIAGRATLHWVGALHRGLSGRLTEEQHAILGLPSRTPAETVRVIEAIRAEMARVGRLLADRHGFAYPVEMETVVQRTWDQSKPLFTRP